MKNLCLILVLFSFGLTSNSQHFNVGVSAGLPTGKAAKFYTLNFALEASHQWKIAETIDLGILTGYSHFFVDESNGFPAEDMSFIPLAGAIRFDMSENFKFGVDLGAAIGTGGDSKNEGLYFGYKIQYRMSDSVDIVAARRILNYDVLSGASRAVVSIGLEYDFH